MEKALNIRYSSADEKDAADSLNNKMMRYVKMMKSPRAQERGRQCWRQGTERQQILEMDLRKLVEM